MRLAKYPDRACMMPEMTFKDEKIAALETEHARLLDVLAGRSKYSIEPTTQVSADSFLLAQNAKLRKALSECVEALKAADKFIGNGIEYGYIRLPKLNTGDCASETPAIIYDALTKAEEVLGNDPITPGE